MIEFLLSLWLPILLSAAAVWIVSAIVWMVMPHHKRDYISLPDEDGFMDHIRKSGIQPGNYAFPDCHKPGAMKSEKVQKAWVEGPVGHLSVWKTPLTMGDKMVGTFIVYLVVSTLIAYLTRVALPSAPERPPLISPESSRSRPPQASSPTASRSFRMPSGGARTSAPSSRVSLMASRMG